MVSEGNKPINFQNYFVLSNYANYILGDDAWAKGSWAWAVGVGAQL